MVKDNKGQVLAMFIILLPLLIMIFALVIDLGFYLNETYKVKSNIVEIINYGLDSNNADKKDIMSEMLEANLDNIDKYDIEINDKIIVTVDGTYESMFKNIVKVNIFKYKFTYIGYIEDNKKIVKKK